MISRCFLSLCSPSTSPRPGVSYTTTATPSTEYSWAYTSGVSDCSLWPTVATSLPKRLLMRVDLPTPVLPTTRIPNTGQSSLNLRNAALMDRDWSSESTDKVCKSLTLLNWTTDLPLTCKVARASAAASVSDSGGNCCPALLGNSIACSSKKASFCLGATIPIMAKERGASHGSPLGSSSSGSLALG